ncbi:YqaA family protein [Noviherbaspirillum sp.]|uniref:YqaA family protein n=1 Tax=Noviherbaspirillum sp. TaxID=1926288 RepID=UPI002FE2DC0B
MEDWSAYGVLLSAAIAAATIVPAQSEAVLVGLLLAGKQSPWSLVLVASIGNIAGSCLNWLLGRYVERFRHRRWFPVKEKTLESAQAWYRRYGKWSLLLSWVPIIGDPITVAAGILREPFVVFLILVTIGKTSRYVVLAAITLGFL